MSAVDDSQEKSVSTEILTRAFHALHRVTHMFASVMDADELLKSIVEISEEAVGAEASALLLRDPERNDLYFSVAHALKGDQERLKREVRLDMGMGIAGAAAQSRTSINVADAQQDDRFYPFPDKVTGLVTRSIIAVPMVGHHELVGVIEVLNKRDGKGFTATDVEVLEVFGQQAALAVQDLRLLQANVQAERLAAVGAAVETLSHSAKNILARIKASGELMDLALEQDDMEMLQNGWHVQKETIGRLEIQVANMLAFGRMTVTKCCRMLCSLSEILEEIVADHDLLFRSKSLAVNMDVASVPEIVVDSEGLRQMLVNLVGNAIDAAPDENGRVSFTVERNETDDGTYIAVADNGPGIPQNILTRVFEPFFTTKGSHGNGLGLAVAEKIATEHGWSLNLVETDDTGACFKVEIPDPC